MDRSPEAIETTQSPVDMTTGLPRRDAAKQPRAAASKLEKLRTSFDEHFKSQPEPVKHDNAAVLLISWEKGDMDVTKEIRDLSGVFKKDYRFQVDHKTLSSEGKPAQTQIKKILSDFVYEHEGPHNLCIIYYAGHGYGNEFPGELFLTDKSDLESRKKESRRRNQIAWHAAERYIEEVDADVLVIFDCCFAGALQGRRSSTRPHSFEYLGACEYDKWTEGPGENSFTSALIYALRGLKEPNPFGFSSQDLRRAIVDAPHFPRNEQHPVLIHRNPPNDDHVWIAPLREAGESTPVVAAGEVGALASLPPAPHYREDRPMEYLDMRFRFSRDLDEEQMAVFGRLLSTFVREYDKELSIKHVKLTNYTGLSIKDIVNRWRKTTLSSMSSTMSSDKSNRFDLDLSAYSDGGANVVTTPVSGCNGTVAPKETTANHKLVGNGGEVVHASNSPPPRLKLDMRDIQEQIENSPNLWIRRPSFVAFKGFVIGVFFTVFLWHQFFFMPYKQIFEFLSKLSLPYGDKLSTLSGTGSCCQ